MYTINKINDPARLSDVERFDVGEGVSLLSWLMEHYGPDGFEVPTQIYRGSVNEVSEINQDKYFDMAAPIETDIYIIHRPLGVVESVYAVVIAIILYLLIPSPAIPTVDQRQQRRSPNNQVFGQTNVARTLERVPDIFGTERSFPDLIAPTVAEFINQEKFLTDYMCITRGFIDWTSVKTGDTLVADIPGSSVAFFDPTQTPAEILRSLESNEVKAQILPGPNSAAVDPTNYPIFYDTTNDFGYVLTAILDDFDGFSPGGDAVFSEVYLIGPLDMSGMYTTNTVEPWVYLTPAPFTGQTINDKFETVIRNSRIYALRYVQFPVPNNLPPGWGGASTQLFQIANISGFDDPVTYAAAINLTLVTETVMHEGVIYSPVAAALPFTTTVFADDKFNLLEVVSLAFQAISVISASVENANWTALDEDYQAFSVINYIGNALISPANQPIQIGPFVAPGDTQDEIWLDLQNPKGLAKGSSLKSTNTVDVKFFFEEIDGAGVPTGPTFDFNLTLSDNDRNARFWTFKVTPLNSDLIAGNRYRVTAFRLNDESVDVTNVSETQWTRLAGITDISATDTSGTTRIVLTTRATEQVASLQEKKLNLIATRKVVTWNGAIVVGDIDTGVGLVASNRFADILLHYMLDPRLGERAEANIDIVALYAIQATLDGGAFSGEKGEFNYTFDGQNSPAISEMLQIAQACRVLITREGSFFSFIRDEAQTVPRSLFNRRNKLPESESRTIRFNKPGDADGVTLEYIDNRDYKPRTIILPDDLPAGDPNFGLPATTNPKKLESIGIKNYSQAWDRAQYEFNRLIYSRISIRSGVTEEALFLPLNSRILHVDGLRLDDTQSDGEIQEIDGLDITTDNRCIFAPATNYSVIFKDADGEYSVPIGVTALPTSEFGFTLDAPSPFTLWVRGTDGRQKGTLYFFAEDGTPDLNDSYLLQRKTPSGNGVEIELTNYAPEYYAADNQTPPPKP